MTTAQAINDSSTTNGEAKAAAKATTQVLTPTMNRRLFEGMLDDALTALRAGGDEEGFQALSPTLRAALDSGDPVRFVETLGELLHAALQLDPQVVTNAITHVRQDHGLTSATAKRDRA